MLQPSIMPTLAQLQEGVEIATQIEAKERQLREMFMPQVLPRLTLGTEPPPRIVRPNKPRSTKRRHGGITEAGRRKLSQAMKRRWAARRAAMA